MSLIHFLLLFSSASGVGFADREVALPEYLHAISCTRNLERVTLEEIVSSERMEQVRLKIRGEDGYYTFPNGITAVGSGFAVSIYSEAEIFNRYNTFERTDRSLAELQFIFEILPVNLLRKLRVLDLPSGKGRFVREMHDFGVDIYGADAFLSRKTLRTGRFFPANFQWTPFQSGAFDVIFSMYGPLSSRAHRASMANDYAELRRILKKGGRLLIGFVSGLEASLLHLDFAQVPGFKFVKYHPNTPEEVFGIVEIRAE